MNFKDNLLQALNYHQQTKHNFTNYARGPGRLDWANQPNPFRSFNSLKTTGFSTWSLRVNPSSGNLHPTEAYLIAPAIGWISNSGFVAHYAPKEHGLEIRAEFGGGFFDGCLPNDCFLVGFSSNFWTEAWKYGERAFRYCNHDIGHAIAAVAMAASGLGWDVKLLDELGFNELEKGEVNGA